MHICHAFRYCPFALSRRYGGLLNAKGGFAANVIKIREQAGHDTVFCLFFGLFLKKA